MTAERHVWKSATRTAIAFVLFVAASGCNGGDPAGPGSDPARYGTSHFDFVLYDGLSWSRAGPVLASLEAEFERLTGDLQVPDPPRVRVEVWALRTTFEAAMQASLGVTYSGATGYVMGRTGVRLLMNENTAVESVHEFAHVLSLNLNPAIANGPRWLWEAVALYEAGQFVDPHSLPYLVQGHYPTLAELNTAYNDGGWKIYEVGYLLSEFIVVRWGRAALVDLIRSSGDTAPVLGLAPAAFETAWHAFLRQRYFSPARTQRSLPRAAAMTGPAPFH